MRWAFRVIDIFFSIGSVAVLFSSASDKNQRIGDLLAKTAVIRSKPSVTYGINDILSIKNAENYTPTYTQVEKFTDQDMLLIKTSIDRLRKYPNEAHKKVILELASKASDQIGVQAPKNKVKFLQTLLQDYIVITRS